MAFIYETTVDPDAEDNSHASTLDMVGYNKRVLEVGCATGYFTKALSDRGCQVVGIELDPEAAAIAEKWAERVVIGNLDAGTLWSELEREQFDAITFGDVLEHLRDPLATLRAAVRTLKPSGIVAISVPNIAHGDVRMTLLNGDFPYSDKGLLDRTHVHFFTKRALDEMIKEAGLVLVETRRVVMPLFQSELGVKREIVDQTTINSILEDPEAETYQFVVKAVQDNGTRTLATLAHRVNELSDHVHDEVVRTALRHAEMHELNAGAERRELNLRAEMHELTLRAEMNELRAPHEEMRKLQRDLERTRSALDQAQRESAESREQVDAILKTKTFRLLAPFRRLYARLRRRSDPDTVVPGAT